MDLLALFVLIWTVFQIVTLAPLCLHDDMLELFAWSRHPSAGSLYGKHPPLAPLIVAAWFAVFPAANWSFELLAAVNAAVGLFAVDLIARRYVAGDRRLLVLLLLLLTPFYQFHSQKFNANAILLSTWPIATYCFLRAFESRRIGWAVAAGVTAALAMLGKYYSVYLIAGFIVAALCHPRRGDYCARRHRGCPSSAASPCSPRTFIGWRRRARRRCAMCSNMPRIRRCKN